MAQFSQRLRLNLPDALPRDGEALAHFFKRVLAAVVEPESHLDYLFFARCQRLEHGFRLLFQINVDHRLGGRDDSAVLDEISEMGIFLFTDRRFKRNRLLRDLQHFADFCYRDVHALGDFFRGRLAPVLLHQLAGGANQLVDGFDHVDGDADGAGLVSDGAGDGLADPPRGISGKLVSPPVFKLVHGLHQADVPFLDQVKKLQAAVRVFLGDGDYQAKVGLDQLALRKFGFLLAGQDVLICPAQFRSGSLVSFLDFFEPIAHLSELLLELLGSVASRAFPALLKALGLALNRPDFFGSLADAFNQPLALRMSELDRPEQL